MFENTCVCDWRAEDGDSPEPFTERLIKARKEHKCCECHEVIKVGDIYELAKGRWDGDWRSYHTCLRCSRIRQDFMSCGWIYGGLWEALRESLLEKNTETGDWEVPAWLG